MKPSTLDRAHQDEILRREGRADQLGIAIFVGTMLVVLTVVAIAGHGLSASEFPRLVPAMVGFGGILGGIALAIQLGVRPQVLRYGISLVQVSFVSAMLVAVNSAHGAEFALATALPLLYALAIAITAFRMNPWLSLFAGTLAAVEFVVVYAVAMAPQLTPEAIAENETLSASAVVVRAVVLLVIGIVCALAAGSLRGQFKKSLEDAGRIDLLERTFGRLVAPEVAREILSDENWMRPARRDAVVVFADLQGFTSFSDGRRPEDVARFLNDCWEVAADVIERHGGVINKYLGDGFLALFGVPMDVANAEAAAAETACELQEKLAPLLEPVGLRLCVGVHSGPLIAGGIGSQSRCEFTVIGSTVNLASRLESLNRSLATSCLTTQPVADKLAGTWELTPHGEHRVKGVSDGVSVFELVRKREAGGSTTPSEV
jgi:adenylate cyclase